VTLVDGTQADVTVVDGTITAIDAPGAAPPQGATVVNLDGHLLLPAAVEPHAHLDKAFLSERLDNPTGDLHGAIRAMIEARPTLTVEDTIERAERAARLMAANGFTAVRTHADTTLDHGLRSVEALAEVRRRVADVIDVEIVALTGWPVVGPGSDASIGLLRDALAAGADVVGGCPHLDVATRPATEVYLEIAAAYGVGVDLHTDETLDPDIAGLADLADVVLETGFPHPVTASHCVSLGMQPLEQQRATAEKVAAAGISVIALPATNLYLQGRDHPQATPRGLTAVQVLREAGVNVAAGADNLQDPFNPMGRACPFETAALTVLAAHLQPDEAWAAVTTWAAAATARPARSVAPGEPADLIAVPAGSVREAIATGAPRRRVWRRGVELTAG
jgi:cytosine deaminase